jgi:DNA-binding CsgD family transcriptional regulator
MCAGYRKCDGEHPKLTTSWLRTLKMALSGKTSLEIAKEVGVKKPTIDSQLYKAYQALGVHNRLQAYHRALSLGLITRFPGCGKNSGVEIAQIDRTNEGGDAMSATMLEPQIHTLENGRRGFLNEAETGVCCEIDEAMFVHFLEESPPVRMKCQVILPGGRTQVAQYVTWCRDLLCAFWIELERGNPGNCRYFAQYLATQTME